MTRRRLLLMTTLTTAAVALLAGATLCLTAGCSSAGYLWQSTTGHLGLMQAARPVQAWVDDPATAPDLKERLQLSQRMRDWAVRELHLPDNDSYRRYADLHRKAAVWNVVAAPELSLSLQTWCFPVVGCVGYRGYYAEADARALASTLQAEGREVSVYGVPAYSTLGWTNWLGGDPLLNTFIRYPEGELARMIFHELSHQVLYVKDDTAFNESFATAVERIGSQRWLHEHSNDAARTEYERYDARRQDFRTLTARTREALAAVYASAATDDEKRQAKARVYADMRREYERLKAGRWDGFKGYDAWFESANNASMGVLGAYNDHVGAFEQLFEQEGRDFPRFYAAVKALAAQPPDERAARLRALARP